MSEIQYPYYRVTLVYNTPLTLDRNLAIDDLAHDVDITNPNKFWANFTKKHSTNINYIDVTIIEQDIKLKIEDIDAMPSFNSNECPNYMIVKAIHPNNDTRFFYYFITSYKYINHETAEFHIYLDTINTFRLSIDMGWSNRTKIVREHRDRWVDNGTNGKRKIDRYSEGINPVLDTSTKQIVKANGLDLEAGNNITKWYIIYRTLESSTQYRLEILICASREIQLTYASNDFWIAPIEAIQKEDPTIIKIIECPYPPLRISRLTSGKYQLASESYWNVGRYQFAGESRSYYTIYKRVFTAPGFNNDLKIPNPLYNKVYLNYNSFVKIHERYSKSFNLESKIFHSDFSKFKLYYDSFGLELQCEKFIDSISSTIANSQYINGFFKVTNNVNSRFLFEISDYISNCSWTNSDYEGLLFVARNNEVLLYSDEYISYLKNGYNYDVKSKTAQDTTNWITTGVSLAGSIATVALASSPVTAVFGATMAASSINKIASSINTQIQSDNSIAAKLQNLKGQAVNVYGADDLDLFSYYSGGNKLIYREYHLNSYMRDLLEDLFYYTGYTTNRMGLPRTNNRVFFNYLQCEPAFNYISGANKCGIPPQFLEDIKQRYRMGVTYIHHVQYVDSSGTQHIWDFNQTKENWETGIASHLPVLE